MRTIILADCHVGSPEANIDMLVRFLPSIECDRLVLAGDFWDLWSMPPKKLREKYSSVSMALLGIRNRGIPIQYILGNHDQDYEKDPLVPLDKVPVVPPIEETLPGGAKLAIIHGDAYDHLQRDYYCAYRASMAINDFFASTIGLSLKTFKSGKIDMSGEGYGSIVKGIHDAARTACLKKGINILVMGHTHAPMWADATKSKAALCNAGDWKFHNSYAEIDGDNLFVRQFKR